MDFEVHPVLGQIKVRMANHIEHKRLSRYFSYQKEHVHSYAADKVFHFNPRGESIWTEEEKAALLQKVSTSSSTLQPDWKGAAIVIPTHSAMDCCMQYMNVLDPAINHSEWTAEEDSHLLILVEKYSEHHWVNIAEELGTRRTPMACLKHYQRTLNAKLLNNDEWSSEEDLLLKAAVESCGKGKWLEVSLQLPGRSSVQCMNRWTKSPLCQDNVVSGKWVEEEERLLFLAAVAYQAPSMKQTKKTEAQLWDLYVKSGLERAIVTENDSRGVTNHSENVTNDLESSDSEDEQIVINNNNTHITAPAVLQQVAEVTTDATPSSGGSFPHWKTIAALIPGKTEVHCREKWFNSLDPSVNAAAYSTDEDMRLARVVYALQRTHSVSASAHNTNNTSTSSSGQDNSDASASVDNRSLASLLTHTDTSVNIKWARVAEYLPGRTDASVRSRWNLLLKGIAKAQPNQPIASVTLKKRAAAQPRSVKRAKGGSVATAP